MANLLLPGCGKSVLAAHLAEEASVDTVVLRYFGGSARTSSLSATASFAVSLTKSLFTNVEITQHDRFTAVLDRVLRLARDYSVIECPLSELLDVLNRLIDLLPTFTLIVDGLDESIHPYSRGSDDVINLLSYIYGLVLRPEARVILLARAGALSGEVFANTLQLDMDENANHADVTHFIEREIERNSAQNEGLRECKSKIITKVSEGCHGMFLWARFIMDSLKNAIDIDTIDDILAKFPAQLADVYKGQMTEISDRLSDTEKACGRRIFSLVASARESFSPLEISDILALNTSSNTVDKGKKLINPTAAILKLCAPLLIIIQDRVQPVHASAREFLLTSVFTSDEGDAELALKCLSKLSQRQYKEWTYPARLLRQNIGSLKLPPMEPNAEGVPKEADSVAEDNEDHGLNESVFYNYACLHWQEHLTALSNLSDELLAKLVEFLTGNEFVTWAEVLMQLKPKSGVGAPIQVRTELLKWHGRLPPETGRKIPISSYFANPYESLNVEFDKKGGDKLLPFLPLVRLGDYFNVGGVDDTDFQRAYSYKVIVASGYEEVLGSRHPRTLLAKTEVFKEFFVQNRFDEAASGLRDLALIQQEVIGEEATDYYFTLQLLGLARKCIAEFEQAVTTLMTAAGGFRRLSGDDATRTLQTEMLIGQAKELTPRFEEAYRSYNDVLMVWVPIGGNDHPFTLMLKTSLGSVCRKLRRFEQAESALRTSLDVRKNLFTVRNTVTIDSAIQLALLYYDVGRSEEAIAELDLVSNPVYLEREFERRCQIQHIRARVQFEAGHYHEPREALERLLNEATGNGENENNRELLWVRVTLADVLRYHNKDDEALMLFSDLVSPRPSKALPPATRHANEDHHFPSDLTDEPEPPAQLTLAETAVRLVKDAMPDEADELLREVGLQWRRKKDFWVLEGGPLTDTASMRPWRPPEPDYQFIDLSCSDKTTLWRSAAAQYRQGKPR
jgi:tetratricopeptide (TPR) repeat protein